MSGWTLKATASVGSRPVARYEHVAALDADPQTGRRLVWLHGGWDGRKPLRDLWKLDIGRHQWNLVSDADGPSERWAHVCAWDPRSRQLWVHGGWNCKGENLQDLWMFHATVERWFPVTNLDPEVSPAGRHDHVAVFDEVDRSLLIHGGWDGVRVFRDVWKFDIETNVWSLLDTGSNGPLPRHDHVAVFDPLERRLWIHGGGDISDEAFSDLWTFQVPTLQWNLVSSGSGPSRCWGHVASWDRTRRAMWLHGGWSSGQLWKFDVAANHWDLQGETPVPMWEHVAAFVETNASHPVLWIHGGRASEGIVFGDLWEFASLEAECHVGQELFSWPDVSVHQGDWWSMGAGMTFFSALFLMLVAFGTALVTDHMLRKRMVTAGLTAVWPAPPSKDSKKKPSTVEGQVGFSGFQAHSVHQTLGHVQAAQMRVLPADMQKVVDYVFEAPRRGKEGQFLEQELGNQASREKYNQLAEDFVQTGCFAFVWRWMIIFGAIHPWSKACCLSFYISHASRVALAVTQLLVAAAIAVVWLAPASFGSLDDSCSFSRSWAEKILMGLYIGLLSWLVMLLLPVMRYTAGSHGRCATCARVMFVCLLVLVSSLCIYLTVVFLGKVSATDAGDWLFTWVVAVIVALLIAPLLLAFCLNVFVAMYAICNPASTQQIKLMRQVHLAPDPPVASIWDGDLDLAPVQLGRDTAATRPEPMHQAVQHVMPPMHQAAPHITPVAPMPIEDEEPTQCDVGVSMVHVTLCPQLSCWEAETPPRRVRLHFASND